MPSARHRSARAYARLKSGLPSALTTWSTLGVKTAPPARRSTKAAIVSSASSKVTASIST